MNKKAKEQQGAGFYPQALDKMYALCGAVVGCIIYTKGED
jgi:hypothetical protein